MTKVIFFIAGIFNVIAALVYMVNTKGSIQDIMMIITFIFNVILFFRLAYIKDFDNYELIKKLDKRISALDNQPRETKDDEEVKNTDIFNQ